MLLPRQAIIDEFPPTRILCNVKTSATWFDRKVTRNRQPLSRSPILFISSRSYYILADIDGVPLAPREIGKVCRRNSIGVALRTAGIRIRTVVAREGGRRERAGSTTQGGSSPPTKRQVRCSWRLSYFITFAFEPHCSSVCFVSGFNLDTGPPFAMPPLLPPVIIPRMTRQWSWHIIIFRFPFLSRRIKCSGLVSPDIYIPGRGGGRKDASRSFEQDDSRRRMRKNKLQ